MVGYPTQRKTVTAITLFCLWSQQLGLIDSETARELDNKYVLISLIIPSSSDDDDDLIQLFVYSTQQQISWFLF